MERHKGPGNTDREMLKRLQSEIRPSGASIAKVIDTLLGKIDKKEDKVIGSGVIPLDDKDAGRPGD